MINKNVFYKKLKNVITVISIGAMIAGTLSGCQGATGSSGELTVGERTYGEAEKDFYFQSAYEVVLQSASGYEQFIGLDTSKDLKEQECSMSESGQTWYEYIMEQAMNQAIQISAEYQDALKNGYKDEDVSAMVNNYMEYYEMLAGDAGESDVDSYLQKHYGEDVTTEVLKRLMTEQSLAEKYEQDKMNELKFTDEELDQYYKEHKFEYSEYSYLYAYLKDDSIETDGLMNAKSVDEFKVLTKELTGNDVYEMNNVKGSEIGDETADDAKWISDESRKEGDTYLGTVNDSHYVLYYIGSNDLGYASDGDQWRIEATAGLKNEWNADWKEEVKKLTEISGSWE